MSDHPRVGKTPPHPAAPRRHRSSPVLAVALASVLGGCGGHASSGPLPTGTHGAGPTTSALAITIPSKAVAARLRSPRYVSVSSQSVQIQLTPGPNCDASCSPASIISANVTPNAPNCASSPGGTTCTLPLGLLPGSYTGGITIYDGQLDVSGTPTGAVLSHGQSVPMQIAPGADTIVHTTLAGVPGGIVFSFVGGAGRYNASTNLLILSTPGASAHMRADPVDADGNIMIGPGAPVVTFPSVGGSYPAQQDPSTGIITVTAPASGVKTTESYTATINSPDCPANPPAACSATLFAGPDVYVAVADTGGNRAVVLNPTGPSAVPVATIPGIAAPKLVAFDGKGDLFVAASTAPYSVRVYAPPYTGAAIATITNGINDPRAMVVASNGDLFIGNDGNNTVTRYAAPYTSAPASTTTAGIAAPHGLLIDAFGRLVVANSGSNTLAAYKPPYASVSASTSTGISTPQALALGSSGYIWVANSGNGTATGYDSSVLGTPVYTVPVGTSPMALAALGGTIVVADQGSTDDVRFLFFPYAGQPQTFVAGVSKPASVAVDAYGSFYVADSGAGNVQQYATQSFSYGTGSSYGNLTNPAGVAAWP